MTLMMQTTEQFLKFCEYLQTCINQECAELERLVQAPELFQTKYFQRIASELTQRTEKILITLKSVLYVKDIERVTLDSQRLAAQTEAACNLCIHQWKSLSSSNRSTPESRGTTPTRPSTNSSNMKHMMAIAVSFPDDLKDLDKKVFILRQFDEELVRLQTKAYNFKSRLLLNKRYKIKYHDVNSLFEMSKRRQQEPVTEESENVIGEFYSAATDQYDNEYHAELSKSYVSYLRSNLDADVRYLQIVSTRKKHAADSVYESDLLDGFCPVLAAWRRYHESQVGLPPTPPEKPAPTPREIQHVLRLEFLAVSDFANLEHIDAAIFQNAASLNTLQMINNRLRDIDSDAFVNLTQLQVLDLSGNQLQALTRDVLKPLGASLRVLILSSNEFKRIESNAFEFMKQLEELYLEKCALGRLPAAIVTSPAASLTNTLQLLMLSHNGLESLEDFGFGLTDDEQLVDHSSLQSFTSSSYVASARSMAVAKALRPDTPFVFVNLKQLALNHNQIKTLREGVFERLRCLEELKLNNNRLETINTGIFFGLKNLKSLILSFNNIKVLPKGCFKSTPRLVYLDLNNNQIGKLEEPSPFEELDLLQVLVLTRNAIELVASTNIFRPLASLESLFLDENEIRAIQGEVFVGLRQLKLFNLSENKLTGPLHTNTFRGLRSLEFIYLLRNPLGKLEPGMFVDSSDSLKSLYVDFERLDGFEPTRFFQQLPRLIMLVNSDCQCYTKDVMSVKRQRSILP